MLRLDKFLCDVKVGSRSQVKEYLKKGMVKVNGEVVKSLKWMRKRMVSLFRERRFCIRGMFIIC